MGLGRGGGEGACEANHRVHHPPPRGIRALKTFKLAVLPCPKPARQIDQRAFAPRCRGVAQLNIDRTSTKLGD